MNLTMQGYVLAKIADLDKFADKTYKVVAKELGLSEDEVKRLAQRGSSHALRNPWKSIAVQERTRQLRSEWKKPSSDFMSAKVTGGDLPKETRKARIAVRAAQLGKDPAKMVGAFERAQKRQWWQTKKNQGVRALRKYGPYAAAGVGAAGLGYGGYRLYKSRQEQEQNKAAAMSFSLSKSQRKWLREKKRKGIRSARKYGPYVGGAAGAAGLGYGGYRLYKSRQEGEGKKASLVEEIFAEE